MQQLYRLNGKVAFVRAGLCVHLRAVRIGGGLARFHRLKAPGAILRGAVQKEDIQCGKHSRRSTCGAMALCSGVR